MSWVYLEGFPGPNLPQMNTFLLENLKMHKNMPKVNGDPN